MGAKVSLQVRGLSIDFSTSWVVAYVSTTFGTLACLLNLKAIGASAVGSFSLLACVRRRVEQRYLLTIDIEYRNSCCLIRCGGCTGGSDAYLAKVE